MTMMAKTSDHDRDLGCCYGAGDENRTRTISLEVQRLRLPGALTWRS